MLGIRPIFELGLQVFECEKNVSKHRIVGFEIWKTKLKPRPKELKKKKNCIKIRIRSLFEKEKLANTLMNMILIQEHWHHVIVGNVVSLKNKTHQSIVLSST